MEWALEMKGVTKRFSGVTALEGVELAVAPGEVMALVGENGAGKSTLMRILAGAERADAGEIRLFGRPAQIAGPQSAIQQGIAMIYQEFNLVGPLSVAENIFLGREPRGAWPGSVGFAQMEREARVALERLGAPISVKARVADLSVAQLQMVEIAKALSQEARILVMDEPSAPLTGPEIETLHSLIRQLKAEGVTIIYISHRLEEVFSLADRVTVLRDGRVAGVRPMAELTRDEMIRLMVGREITELAPKQTAPIGETMLEVRGLSRAGALRDVSLSVRRGEVVGLAGLVGSGRTELARALFGADPSDRGEIWFEGRPLNRRDPAEAIRRGIGLLTEDRKQSGLLLHLPIRENISVANLGAVSTGGFVRKGSEREAAAKLAADLRIRSYGVEQLARTLSGGNQQKVVLAKWLFTDCRLLIFDEPTRGIDVGAKREIYQLMNALTQRGAAVLMISSDLPEVLGMSDRIYVMHRGAIAGELARGEANQENVMRLATGEGLGGRGA